MGKHFLTISSATAVFVVTFADKVIGPAAVLRFGVKACMVLLVLSIASAGVGLFVNYVAGAGASGAIIWGVGRNFRALTMGTYILYLIAGSALVFAFGLLAYEALQR